MLNLNRKREGISFFSHFYFIILLCKIYNLLISLNYLSTSLNDFI